MHVNRVTVWRLQLTNVRLTFLQAAVVLATLRVKEEVPLTNETKDVSDSGDENHQHVIQHQDGGSDAHVAEPVKLLVFKHQGDDRWTDLKQCKNKDMVRGLLFKKTYYNW